MEIDVVRFLKHNVYSIRYHILTFNISNILLLLDYKLKLTWSWLHHLYAKTWRFVIRSIRQTRDRCCMPIAPVTYQAYTLH